MRRVGLSLVKSNFDFSGPDLSDLSSVTSSYVAENGDYQGIHLKDDGTKMFVANDSGFNRVNTYNLSTPWDITTKGTRTAEEWTPAGLSQPNDLRFNADGTRIIIVSSGVDEWTWADLSTAYDLSTAGSPTTEPVPASETTGPTGLVFTPDGTTLFLGGVQTVWIYTLSTPFDPSTKGSATQVLDVSAVQTSGGLFGIDFAADGMKFYSADITDNVIDQWNLTVPYDLTTATHQPSQTIAAGTNPFGLWVRKDGAKKEIFVSHNITNKIITKWS